MPKVSIKLKSGKTRKDDLACANSGECVCIIALVEELMRLRGQIEFMKIVMGQLVDLPNLDPNSRKNGWIVMSPYRTTIDEDGNVVDIDGDYKEDRE